MYQSGGIASSGTTDVNVSTGSASSLQMSCTTGAPVFDPTVPVRPVNMVFLSGPPGADVGLSLPGGSDTWFNPDGVQTLQLRLDTAGTVSAQVYGFTAGGADVTDAVAESVVFTLSLPDTGARVQGTLVFTAPSGALSDSLRNR
ncbi:hypothetical protein L8P27_16780 [Enterobacter asburiae]|uniref:hypothetical protein n=1 Tax=Enterobacter asburiae TaxID=61645 RepID=UPI00200390AD|nr:hypothetical protein [Enterobacter asburiae]MCK7229465.1 hypothetical protein [Enterobacter asburiae]